MNAKPTSFMIVFFGLCIHGCGADLTNSGVERVGETTGETLAVWWQGNLVQAEVDGDLLLVEGDIEVGRKSEVERYGRQALVIQSADARWPGGVVPYDFAVNANDANGVAPTAAQRTTIRGAMDDLEEAVPGLSFVLRTTESDYVSVYISNANSSPVGRRTDQQFARVTAAQVGSFTMHHELAHALGFFHEHTRKDAVNTATPANSWVQINWGNIQGCPTTAGGPDDCGNCAAGTCGCDAGTVCNFAGNFMTDNLRSNVLEYDYDSIMHYPVDAFSWTGANTITTLRPLNGATVGNRTAFSELDIQKMRVAYPVVSIRTFVFSDTGEQVLCRLDGREDDVANEFSIVGWSGNSTGRVVQTNGIGATGSTVTCQVRSVFFAENYDYPNSSTDPDLSSYPGSSVETYSETVTVVTQPTAILAALL